MKEGPAINAPMAELDNLKNFRLSIKVLFLLRVTLSTQFG